MGVIEIQDGQFFSELQKAGDKLVVVDFTAQWCGPCKMISPVFEQLSSQYKQVVFLKVDVDKCSITAQNCGVSAMPTFQFYIKSKKVAEFSGADQNRLKQTIEQNLPAQSFTTPGHALGHGSSTQSRLLDLQTPTTAAAPTANPQMLSELKEMGFPENRAIKALLTVKNQSTDSAMEWIFANMDNPDIDEPFKSDNTSSSTPSTNTNTTTTTSTSTSTTATNTDSNEPPTLHNALCDICTQQIVGIRYKCKVCPNYDLCQVCKDSGKHLADHEFDAHEKDIVNPQLTDEERRQQRDKLEARIQEVRKKKAEDEAKREIDREINRRQSGKMQQESVTKWQETQIKREAEKARKEKEDELRAKQRIRDKIAQDKLERQAKKAGTTVPTTATTTPAAPVAAAAPPAAPAAIPDQVLIQIRLQSGEVIRSTFKPTDSLKVVHDYVSSNGQSGSFRLSTTYPRKIYEPAEMKTTTLLDAGLVPNGTLMVTK